MLKHILLTLLLLSPYGLAEIPKGVMEYRYWDWGKTPKRDDYQVAVLQKALEKTQHEYGAFNVIRHKELFSTSRSRREVNRGEIVNVSTGPWRPIETEPAKLAERSLRVEIPIMSGLLGYRLLIIRKEDEQKFKHITQEDELKKNIAGQARGWKDVDIYRHNGYQVDDIANLTSLFSMLKSKRFDYLPMSIAEAKSALASNKDYSQSFVIAQNIIIYYPLPIIFYVSENYPLLAERLNKGMLILEKEGLMDKLFNQFFAADIEQVKKQKPRCFVLDNPYIPEHLKQPKPLLLQ
jgi:hypothetical protein